MCTDENNDKNKMNKMNLPPSPPPSHLSTPVIVLLIAEKKNN